MQIRSNDGQLYQISGTHITDESATALVEAMRSDSRSPSESAEEFMKQIAHRCRLQNNSEIATDNPQNFVNDLLKFGFLAVAEI